MPSHSALILTVAASIGIAFLFGLAAARLRLPPIVGYLLAGIVVGPFTPGYVVDSGMIAQAAELGVILLMFGVGLHFSLGDLSTVRRIVLPGALLNSAASAGVGIGLARLWGQSWGAALVLGLSISVASTVVLLKGLEAQDRLDSPEGRIAVGWLVVEDLLMVFVLVLLPTVAPLLGGTVADQAPAGLAAVLGIALLKVVAFAALMVVVGRRAVPWLLSHVAKLGSRELFTLAVLTIALGIGALASEVFGVSFALGAFFAGAVVSESELSKRAASEALPMQDAFAVLFFLSVGMLFDPKVVLAHPLQILALVVVVVVGKLASSYFLMRWLKQPKHSALILGSSLSQIGEFSFMVSGLGFAAGLIDRDLQAMVVATALIAITLNQPLLAMVRVTADRLEARDAAALTPAPAASVAGGSATSTGEDPFDFSHLGTHVVVVGHGRVGITVTEALQRDSSDMYVVIEEQERLVAGMRSHGERAILGDATRADVLHRAGIDSATLIVVTAPEPIRARRIVEVARELNPRIAVAVRTHSAAEQAYYEDLLHMPGAQGRAIYAEREVALSLAHYTLAMLGRTDDEADMIIDSIRNAKIRPTETFRTLPTREFRAIMATDPNLASKEEG
jgi:CPA2 family monovalent cation:H+ antiporter-2